MQTKVIQVDPKTLKLLEVNARFMRHEEFQRLVANVKQDGQLTSAPFAARNPDGTYEVLSGNHRVQAAIAAGLESIQCPIKITHRINTVAVDGDGCRLVRTADCGDENFLTSRLQ